VRSNLELLGGGKKRKKKTYTKPKKIKGKHKKVKLAVLKYYKVDQASGKVTRLRKECPQCGAGIFMAMHFNRHYCGKCHLTFMLENPGRDPALDKKKEGGPAAAADAAPAKAAAKGKKKK
jgi:ubiquitin-small subunit ribosomal protein S27Ae